LEAAMTCQCAWCGKILGHAAPQEDHSISHGACPSCAASVLSLGNAHSHSAPDPSADSPIDLLNGLGLPDLLIKDSFHHALSMVETPFGQTEQK